MPYPYKGESKGISVARIVIEPNPHKGHEEMPGDLEILFLDAEDNLVDVWSAGDLKTAGSLLSKYGDGSGIEGSDYTPRSITEQGITSIISATDAVAKKIADSDLPAPLKMGAAVAVNPITGPLRVAASEMGNKPEEQDEGKEVKVEDPEEEAEKEGPLKEKVPPTRIIRKERESDPDVPEPPWGYSASGPV